MQTISVNQVIPTIIATTSGANSESPVEKAIASIAQAMRQHNATCIGCSFGKDSSSLLGLTLEAARRLKESENHNARIIIMTADTGVENPSMTKLARTMSERALTFARQHNLNVTQKWVTPAPGDHYMVQMIGGRATASVPGSSANCTLDLKIRPMEKAKKQLSVEFGGDENILTLIGTRKDESMTRSTNMTDRNESDETPIIQENGGKLLSPLANWKLGDVWSFLNARHPFPGLDFTPVLAVYETVGESTCSIGAIDPDFGKKTAGGCGSAGRTGCWACQRVSQDHSLEAMADRIPAYEPLVRLSKAIRAGHSIPENRSYLGKTAQNGSIRVFSNGYSPSWTSQLLKWTLTIDADEDDRAASKGKPRRFPRILENEHVLLIAFQWARYGLHKPGEFSRIYNAIANGKRFDLPTDGDLAEMSANAKKTGMGKTLGWIDTRSEQQKKPAFRDSWRDMLDSDALCQVPVMSSGRQTQYKAGSGQLHDSLIYSDGICADVSNMDNDRAFSDFMSWHFMDFGAGSKTHAEEMRWLLREGVIRARRGYQSKIAQYIDFGETLADLGLQAATKSDIINHPQFRSEPAATPLRLEYPSEQLALVG